MKRYIVTGGAGFIGSHIVETMLENGAEVFVIDNLTSGLRENLPDHSGVHVLAMDILSCAPADLPVSVDGIVHLAARPSVVDSWAHPMDVHQANLSSTIAVIELCRQLEIPRIVFASSASVYGNQEILPVDEGVCPNPASPYGLQKLASESYLNLFCGHYGISAASLRFFNVYGPRQQPGSPYSGVISLLLDAMLEQQPFTIFGDGEQTRDFVYVKDVAGFVCRALQCDLPRRENTVLNIGSGQQVSINQLIELLRRHIPDWQAEIRHAPERPGDIKRSQADVAKAAAILGGATWDMETGLTQYLKDLL